MAKALEVRVEHQSTGLLVVQTGHKIVQHLELELLGLRWMVAKSESTVENGGKHPIIGRDFNHIP